MTSCDVCRGEKGLEVEAVADAPTPWGVWAMLCAACLYRLPAALKSQSVALVEGGQS